MGVFSITAISLIECRSLRRESFICPADRSFGGGPVTSRYSTHSRNGWSLRVSFCRRDETPLTPAAPFVAGRCAPLSGGRSSIILAHKGVRADGAEIPL